MVNSLLEVFSVLILGLQGIPDTPAEKFAALLGEYRPVSAGLRKADTDRERKAAVERLGSFVPRFVELAEAHPKDAVTLEVLRQAIQALNSTDSAALIARELNRSEFPTGSSDEWARRIVTLLLRNHGQSDTLGPLCGRMRYGYRMEWATCLRTILRENPHREIQAVACLFLAQFLNDRLRMVRLADDRPELGNVYQTVFGRDYLPDLRRRDRATLAGTIESLFQRAAEDYGDVKISFGDTVGAKAKSELYEMRNLAVGKAAPDIEGRDQDGAAFKLSDYRGKVVLLHFWVEI